MLSVQPSASEDAVLSVRRNPVRVWALHGIASTITWPRVDRVIQRLIFTRRLAAPEGPTNADELPPAAREIDPLQPWIGAAPAFPGNSSRLATSTIAISSVVPPSDLVELPICRPISSSRCR